jgi:hypothetical protein
MGCFLFITLASKKGQIFFYRTTIYLLFFQVVRMGLDGADRRPIVEDNLHWPNGIAVDQILDRVYWSDAHFDVLESIKIDGTDRRVILKDVDKHPFGLAVFEVYGD